MSKTRKVYKITVYVPEDNFGDFIEAIQDKIPSFGAEYDRVGWWSYAFAQGGIEQYRPLEGAHPAKGEIGDTVRAATTRLELHIPFDKEILNNFIAETLIPAHPWESPVIAVQKTKLY
jgi:hypothetical protein